MSTPPKLLPRPLGGSRLTRDYLAGVEAANSFYRGSPYLAETYRHKAEELDLARGRDTFATAERVVRPAGPGGAALLRRVVAEGGYFVTTGQQPGLFGGPLYSLYKALTAVRLAADLEELLARPVMPLFWVASDDHDWEEANHTFVVDGSNRLVHLTLGARRKAPPDPWGAHRWVPPSRNPWTGWLAHSPERLPRGVHGPAPRRLQARGNDDLGLHGSHGGAAGGNAHRPD